MRFFLKLYRFINILSLDVVAGAVVSTLFFARVFSASILPSGLISLALTVWIIYTTDHLIDAKRLQKSASTDRHRFHQIFFNVLLLFLIFALLVDVTQLFFIRQQVFNGGLILAGIVLIYFLLQRKLKFLKELMGALLYLGGVLLIPLSMKNSFLLSSEIVLIANFFLTALINLLLFSWFDKNRDEQDNHSSFTLVFGEAVTKRILIILFVTNFILTSIQFVSFTFGQAIILFAMNCILFLILINNKYFEKEDRYRLLGDAVFFLPLIYILMEWC